MKAGEINYFVHRRGLGISSCDRLSRSMHAESNRFQKYNQMIADYEHVERFQRSTPFRVLQTLCGGPLDPLERAGTTSTEHFAKRALNDRIGKSDAARREHQFGTDFIEHKVRSVLIYGQKREGIKWGVIKWGVKND